jgi:uncharacterized protein (DUF433 family)
MAGQQMGNTPPHVPRWEKRPMTTPPDDQHIVSDPEISGGRPSIGSHRIAVMDLALWTRRSMTPEWITQELPFTREEVLATPAEPAS